MNPDEIRKLYSKTDILIPNQVQERMSSPPEKILSGEELLRFLNSAVDNLEDSFCSGEVLLLLHTDKVENESGAQLDNVVRKRNCPITPTLTISYQGTDGRNTISFPSPVYTFTETDKYLIEFDPKSKRQNAENFRELTLTMNPPYKQLLDAAEVSPFGHNSETVIDPTVRKASHIPADRIAAIEGLDLDSIIESVRLKLFPYEPRIQAKVTFSNTTFICFTTLNNYHPPVVKAQYLSRGRLLCSS